MLVLLTLWVSIGGMVGCARRTEVQTSIQTPQLEIALAITEYTEQQQPTRAERFIRAIHAAHPRRIERVEFRNGDWALLLDNIWFYYANGRMLPAEFLYRTYRYRHIAMYYYPHELPILAERSPEEISGITNFTTVRAQPRPPYFFDTLYNARNREESYRQQTNVRFLGHPVQVHHAITPALALVQQRILETSETDASVRAWIDNIDRMYGWVWRNIGGTQSRSFHSYGIAIDIMPRFTGGREIYWRWAGPNWLTIPYERRYHPPDPVIQAFESFGFIWGGKWPVFDTIHFEYRPELLLYNNFVLENLRQQN